MAVKTKKSEEKEKEVFKVEVTKATECSNGSIMLNMTVNGVKIYGAFYRTVEAKKGKHAGEEIGLIDFPKRKGKKDGEDAYFDTVSFFIDDETMAEIEKQIESLLE